jgi:hypothetical protein
MKQAFRGDHGRISASGQHQDPSCPRTRSSADRCANTSTRDRSNASAYSAACSNLCQVFLLRPSRLIPERIRANILIHSASVDRDQTKSKMGTAFNSSALVRIGYLQRNVGTARRHHNSVHNERILKRCSYGFPRTIHAGRNGAGGPNPHYRSGGCRHNLNAIYWLR